MTAKNMVSKATLALAVAAVVLPMSGVAMAGGYGYASQSGWSGYQAQSPQRQKVRKHAYAGSNRHLAWCYNRYRSYRLMDNSFQPYHGPRRECLSPYEQERRALFVGYPGEAPEILFRDQAGSDVEQTERDAFGNLSESGPVTAGSNGGQADEFGNLSEQAALSGEAALAEENRPGAASAQGSTTEGTPATSSETDQLPVAAADADESEATKGPASGTPAPTKTVEAQSTEAALADTTPVEDADGETATD